MKKIITALIAIVIGSAIIPSSALAGPAADALGTCLADNTTGKERKFLVQWVFAGISAHPDMQSLSNVTEENREELNRMMASIVTRLTTENCLSEVKQAVEKEDVESFQSAFKNLGGLAMQELMSDPKVNSSFTSYTKYFDKEKLKSAFSNK